MRRFLTCFLALCCAALLVACEWSAVPLEGDKPPVDSPPEPMEITGQLAEYTEGNVDVALTIPDGWWWETLEEEGQSGLRFGKTGERSVAFRLTCWLDGYGICGTDVTSEELTLSGGQKVWQHTEESDDGLWLNLYFESVPGDYVCQFADSVLDKAVWEAGRDEVLAILGTAQFGRDAMTEQAAIDAAAAQYDGEYDMAYGRYSVVDGCWTVTFSKGAAGENSESFKITPQGSVTAAE